jgi:hypothetical protein
VAELAVVATHAKDAVRTGEGRLKRNAGQWNRIAVRFQPGEFTSKRIKVLDHGLHRSLASARYRTADINDLIIDPEDARASIAQQEELHGLDPPEP